MPLEQSGPNTVWNNFGGSGVFVSKSPPLGNSASYSVALGDLYGNGDLDAVVGDYQKGKVWINNS